MHHRLDLFIVILGRLSVALISLASVRVATTYLSPADYGQLSLLIAIQTFCALLFINPIGQYINLHTHEWWSDGSLLLRIKFYPLYLGAVSMIGAVITFVLSAYFLMSPWYGVSAVFLMTLMASWNATLLPMLNSLGFRAPSILMAVASIAIGLAASILIIWAESPSASGWYFGQGVGMSIGVIFGMIFFRRIAPRTSTVMPQLTLINRSSVVTYCLPLAVATSLMWCQLSGYRFLVESYWGLAALGFLAIGLQVPAQISALLESLVMQFLYPYFFSRVSGKVDKDVIASSTSDLLNVVFPLYIICAGITILGAPYLISLLLGPKFQGQSYFLVIGVFVELFRMLGNTLGNAAHAKRETKLLAIPYGFGAVATISLFCLAGILQLPINVAALSMVIGGVFVFAAMWFGIRKSIRLSIQTRSICLACCFLLLSVVLGHWMPNPDSLGMTIYMLLILSALAFIGIFFFLQGNVALKRLLSVQLRAH